MAKQTKMAIHSPTASTDSAAVSLVKFILSTHHKVAVQLRDYDTWPNTDGVNLPIQRTGCLIQIPTLVLPLQPWL